jgi:hypothetical protein
VLKINLRPQFHPANGSYGRECAIPGILPDEIRMCEFLSFMGVQYRILRSVRARIDARKACIPIRRRVRTVAATKILILDVWARSFVPLSRILDRCAHRAQPVNRQAANTKLCVPHITKKYVIPADPRESGRRATTQNCEEIL